MLGGSVEISNNEGKKCRVVLAAAGLVAIAIETLGTGLWPLGAALLGGIGWIFWPSLRWSLVGVRVLDGAQRADSNAGLDVVEGLTNCLIAAALKVARP